ncbi:MAG: hypothetical protein R3E39_02150 [Anaerolineae bacterium]
MNRQVDLSVHRRRSLFLWAVFCATAGIVFLAYALTSLANGHGEFVMPLDDVYIHFQYAKQIASGQFYVYNPGLPPTSGATSFLYPYVLAAGYLAGFQGLNLGLWAMSVGAVAVAVSMWLVYRLVWMMGTARWLAVVLALAFGVSGPVVWHFMSGMETGLVILLTLWTFYEVVATQTVIGGHVQQGGYALNAMPLLACTLLALVRPEGGLLAIVAVGALWLLGRRDGNLEKDGDGAKRKIRPLWMIIPIMALGVQPLVNWLMTGSAVASGNSAKSVFGAVPFVWGEVIRRVLENLGRMWVEFATGISPREGTYIAPLLLVVGLLGLVRLVWDRRLRPVGLMVMLWFLGGTLMIATLDTSFWHFKRYQMPFMALLFPLAGIGIGVLISGNKHLGKLKYGGLTPFLSRLHRNLSTQDSLRLAAAGVIGLWIVVIAGLTAVRFLGYYGLNVSYVYLQPLQMARWLEANTPSNAVVAVHDVGMMRYMGGRTTLDVVGLTTAGAADYWRNGPGAVAEFLLGKHPDYIASYGEGHGLGLGLIAETSIYGEALASFPVELDDNANVALAANFQGIYKPDWKLINTSIPEQRSILKYVDRILDSQGTLRDVVNVADIAGEREHDYHWKNDSDLSGFPTLVRQLNYVDCGSTSCTVVDGGRQINGEETFQILEGASLDGGEGNDVLLITRVNPSAEGTLDIYIAGRSGSEKLVATRWIPSSPGQWVEIPTLIPSEFVTNNLPMKIRIVPHLTDGVYEPYMHAVLVGHYRPEKLPVDNPLATFQNGAIQLESAIIDFKPSDTALSINLKWFTDGSAQGDYKVFVHVYSDVNQPPVAQTDERPGNGALPPGNWLPGVLRDTITVNLQGILPGRYTVAIGMYDPVTFERSQPTGGDADGRLFIGEVTITE